MYYVGKCNNFLESSPLFTPFFYQIVKDILKKEGYLPVK